MRAFGMKAGVYRDRNAARLAATPAPYIPAIIANSSNASIPYTATLLSRL